MNERKKARLKRKRGAESAKEDHQRRDKAMLELDTATTDPTHHHLLLLPTSVDTTGSSPKSLPSAHEFDSCISNTTHLPRGSGDHDYVTVNKERGDNLKKHRE
jgi:hypothetical protein